MAKVTGPNSREVIKSIMQCGVLVKAILDGTFANDSPVLVSFQQIMDCYYSMFGHYPPDSGEVSTVIPLALLARCEIWKNPDLLKLAQAEFKGCPLLRPIEDPFLALPAPHDQLAGERGDVN